VGHDWNLDIAVRRDYRGRGDKGIDGAESGEGENPRKIGFSIQDSTGTLM
jgi:hypothetical protein